MPNVRSQNQRLIAFPLDAELLAELERARRGKTRSQFIREAVREKLTRMGFAITEDMILPPDRARSPMRTTINGGSGHTVNQNYHLNETPEPGPATPPAKPVRYSKKKPRRKKP